MSADLEDIRSEVVDPSTSAQRPEDTFAVKWLNRVYNVVWWWNWFAAIVFGSQVIVFAVGSIFPSLGISNIEIPGQAIVYGAAGTLSAAYVGGEKIVDRLNQNRVNRQQLGG